MSDLAPNAAFDLDGRVAVVTGASSGLGARFAREETLAGEPVTLTAREFDLLAYLVAHSGQVCDRERILRDVWRSTPDWQDLSTVTEHVRRLRQQLEADPAKPTRILTVRGRGYRWAG